MGIIRNQISRINTLNLKSTYLLLIIIDIICIGMGMGVPIFNIALGFPAGWFFIKKFSSDLQDSNALLNKLLKGASILSLVTLAGMVLTWGWSIKILSGTDVEIENFGIPMIMYSPRASLISWLILMIVISPFLQLLTTVFAGSITILKLNKKSNH